ncbi:MAG: acetyl-CoA synthase subunit gamma [Nitrospirae bacterium]|nr:acetyl-CoA synthase subunit gamma [Nitrospirota bacterium]
MAGAEKTNGGSCCASESASASAGCRCPQNEVSGYINTKAGLIAKTSAQLYRNDYWGEIKSRLSAFRNNYAVVAGLYAVGEPSEDSDVFVSANYKLSFDKLRSALAGISAWILVLDTKGVNVWCAAGKGTFSTEELIKKISETNIDLVVRHKKLIVPQLGAVGISAYKVLKATGFRVLFGPVYAADIVAYVNNGYKATAQMRTIRFNITDRLVLTPMEMLPILKWYPVYAAAVLIFFGVHGTGIVFRDAFYGGAPFLFFGLVSVFAGAFMTPVLLPFIPFRAFSLKGWMVGLMAVFLAIQSFSALPVSLKVFVYLFFPAVSSFAALQFTGSTTFTGMSGVKKELKYAVFAYVIIGVASLISLIIYKSGVL